MGHQGTEVVPVTRLHGVAQRVAERLARLGIATVQDLLLHLPMRYQDRTRIIPIAELQPGMEALIEGTVADSVVRHRPRRTLRIWLVDGGAGLQLRFFHFSTQQATALVPGVRLRCFGEVRQGYQSLEMVHPEYRRVEESVSHRPATTLTPVYPTTEGLQQTTCRTLVAKALDWLECEASLMPELLPRAILADQGLPSLAEAIALLHRPPHGVPEIDISAGQHPALRRVVLEELVAHQLSLRRLRQQQGGAQAPRLAGDGGLQMRLLERLPFALTAAQRRVVAEIAADMRGSQPMQRLLQGDVGAGKTLVAVLAALQAIESGYQVALMAPTELLSEQHRRTLDNWLRPLGIEPEWLAGRHKGRNRTGTIERIATGAASMVVGTHALFQDDVVFARLGLVIIDEQHRFGVQQRKRLMDKGGRENGLPHQLIMTATPIPRSLAMTVYADLDLSVIDAMPPGRKPITTVAIPDGRRDEVIGRVRDFCTQGHQAYWVCTLVEESEVLQCQAAEEAAQRLSANLKGLRVGLVHGRLKGTERDEVMGRFVAGQIDLLVATTVIEVGVDVPRASLMIIENPERLGLAQLHQLRGRIGRGSAASYCVLLYQQPLSELAKARLALLRETDDGFVIARRDLELRGPGEVLGTRQTGAIQFRVADPLRDERLLPRAQQMADRLLTEYPELVDPLVTRWLGGRDGYGCV